VASAAEGRGNLLVRSGCARRMLPSSFALADGLCALPPLAAQRNASSPARLASHPCAQEGRHAKPFAAIFDSQTMQLIGVSDLARGYDGPPAGSGIVSSMRLVSCCSPMSMPPICMTGSVPRLFNRVGSSSCLLLAGLTRPRLRGYRRTLASHRARLARRGAEALRSAPQALRPGREAEGRGPNLPHV
jgi:hypothetical protein